MPAAHKRYTEAQGGATRMARLNGFVLRRLRHACKHLVTLANAHPLTRGLSPRATDWSGVCIAGPLGLGVHYLVRSRSSC